MPPMQRRPGSRASSANPNPSPLAPRTTRATAGGTANTTTRRPGIRQPSESPNIQIRTAAANAYGDPAPQPPPASRRQIPSFQETIRNLEPERERPRPAAGRLPGRTSNVRSLDPNRTFRDESLINTAAAFDTSSVVAPETSDDEDDPEPPPTTKRPSTQRPPPKKISPRTDVPPPTVAPPAKGPSPPKVMPPKVASPPKISPPRALPGAFDPPKASPPKASPPKRSSPKKPVSPRRQGGSSIDAWTTWGGLKILHIWNLFLSAWNSITDSIHSALVSALKFAEVGVWKVFKGLGALKNLVGSIASLFNWFQNRIRRLFSRGCLLLLLVLAAVAFIPAAYTTLKNTTWSPSTPSSSAPSDWSITEHMPTFSSMRSYLIPSEYNLPNISGKISGLWSSGNTDDAYKPYHKIIKEAKDGKFSDETKADLENILPDNLVVKKDQNGVLQIPIDFWSAFKDKTSTREAHQVWDKFVEENAKKVSNLKDSVFKEKYPEYPKQNVAVSIKEAMELIQQSAKDQQERLGPELANLETQLEVYKKEVTTLQKNQGRFMTKEDLMTAINDHFQAMISSGQWQALANANLKGNINYGRTRVNHWSRGTGATVDGTVTSPNYVFPFMKKAWPTKQFRRFIGNKLPVPNPPAAALENWEEHGDCWCSPADDNEGYGPTLGVISGRQFYPDEVVIEHITPSASIQPGSTPKNMELLAYIEDFDTYDAVLKLSENLFNDGVEVEPKHEFHYIKVASWTYDMNAGQTVQAFPVQLDLKQFNAPITKLVVRAKDNWGKEDYTCLYRVRVHGDIVGQEK